MAEQTSAERFSRWILDRAQEWPELLADGEHFRSDAYELAAAAWYTQEDLIDASSWMICVGRPRDELSAAHQKGQRGEMTLFEARMVIAKASGSMEGMWGTKELPTT